MMDRLFELHQGDCLEVMREMADNSVDLIATDPPYHRVKNLDWDKQWKTNADFLSWIGKLCDEWQRILKPNGSLYCFASPEMSHGVEGEIRKRFNVLNNIRWVKDAGWHRKADKEIARSFYSPYESVIFAEHFNSDNYAKGEAGYQTKCDELRGFVFEPIRAYLDGERIRAGLTTRQVAEAFQRKTGSRTVTGMAGHWFTNVQWVLPTEENYQWLRLTLSSLNHGGSYLTRPYEDLRQEYEDLRQEYEDLRQEYEDLRRPFTVTSSVPYTDVWDFPTVQAYKGKHPCEKPLAMMEHIVKASSREGAVVLDCFMGSGVTGIAAVKHKRQFIGIEKEPEYFEIAKSRIERAELDAAQSLFTMV